MINSDFFNLLNGTYNFDKNYAISDPKWLILDSLYRKNYLLNNNEDIKIPKKIHQIWLGGDIPPEYLKLGETWKEKHPDWEYKLWTDEDVKTYSMINRKQFDLARNPGMKSDIFRYEILYKEGGLYVDTDFECLKNFEKLSNLEFYTGVAYNKEVELYIGLIASTPNNKIIESCIQNMSNVDDTNWVTLFNSTGTYYFTRNFFKNVSSSSNNIVAFPMCYFYPYPNNVRENKDRNFIESFVRDETMAIHHWFVSWMNK